MSRSSDLDPDEVLMHLRDLGYNNIQPQQLDEFIRDLKKLIKHDMTKKNVLHMNQGDDDTSSTLPNTTDESVSPSPPPQTSSFQNMQRKHRIHHISEATKSKGSERASSSSSDSSVPASRILRECTKLVEQKSHSCESSKAPSKPAKPCGSLWRRIGCKCCEDYWSKEQQSIKSTKSKENLAPPRPKSSFIRTWQMTGQPRPGSAPQRSDPVSLYHQYQQVWKQQKLPGENNHNDLRWMIRERMLGQEPHPRPLSQASSVTSMSSRRKRL